MSTTTATAASVLAEIEGRVNLATVVTDEQWYVNDDGSVWVDHSGTERLSMSGLTGTFPIWADGAAELIAHAPADLKMLASALRAVLALHRVTTITIPSSDGTEWDFDHCTECDADTYPCPTVTAITAALSASEAGK